MSSKKKKDTTSPRKEKEETKGEKKKKKGSSKDKHEEKDVHEKTTSPRKEDSKGDKKKKKGSKHAKAEMKIVVSEPLNVEKKEKKKKKKKGTKRGKEEVLHRGLSVADEEGDNLLDALSTIANAEPVDEEKQYAEFVKKLTNDGDFEFPGESAPAKPRDSSSAKLDSIDDALAALENWDSESKNPPSKENVGDIAASELDALLAEMGQSLEEDEKSKKEEEEKKKNREEEDRRKKEEERKKEEDRKEALRLEELKKAEEEKKRKEKEAEEEKKRKEKEAEEEKKRKEAEEEKKKKEKEAEEEKKRKEAEEEKKKKEKEAEEEKKKKEAEKAKNSPATNSRKSQAFSIEIAGVRSAEPKKVEAVVVTAVEEDLPIADRVRKEFIETENSYVEGLSIIMKMYYRPLEISGLIRPKDIETIFYAVSQIHDIHSKLLVDLLDAENKAVTGGASVAFATVLAKFVPFLKIYTEYINHYDEANRRLNKLVQKEKKFAAFLKECQAKPECKSLDLSSYLISPIQRLPRYELLLRDYLKHSKDEKERKQIEALFNAVVDVNRYINQRKGDSELRKKKYKLQKILKQHKVDLFNRTDREYIKEGPLQICEIAEKEPKDLLAAEGSMRITQTISSRKLAKKLYTPFKENYFFLFDDILIQVLLSHDDGEYNYKYVRHYATQSISVENVTLNSPAVGVLLDPVDETANGILLTWLTSEKSAEGDEFSDVPVAPAPGRESTRMYMRRFYLKAAHPQEKQEWKEAIEKHSALSVDGIIDNKIKRGTIRLPGSPGLPSTPEEAAAYKDQMKRKYEDEQRKSTILLQGRKDERKFDAVEAERILSSLETRVPVMDIFTNRGSPKSPPSTHQPAATKVPEVPATGDLNSQMALLDKELHTWEAKRKEGTWGKSSTSPFAASARSTPPVPSVRLKTDSSSSSIDFEKEVEKKFSGATVNDDELSALLRSLDESDNFIDIREELVSVKSTSNEGSATNTPMLARASSVSSSMNNTTTTTTTTATTTYTTQPPSLGEIDRLSSLERLQREQEAKVLEAQREAERVKRELEQERQREKERERERIEREIKEKFERMQREEALKTAGVGALLCNFCFAPIGGAAYVKVGDKAYHADHFNCIVCGTGLAGKSFYPVGDDKKPHCTDCYDRLNAIQCNKCRRPITGPYTVVFEKNWHQECLVCVNCGCQFTDARADPSKRMMSKDDEPICKGCFGRTWSQNRKCAHCGQAVLNTSTDGKMSPTLDKCWHNECFICTSCSSHLTDPKWRDNKPYCFAHY